MTTRRAPSKIIPRAFPGIKAKEVTELISNSQVHAYVPGTALCQENAVEDTFYIILEGEAEVTKVINNTEVRLLKNLRYGDFFGEMALIHNVPRAATVTAKTHLVALELQKEAFVKGDTKELKRLEDLEFSNLASGFFVKQQGELLEEQLREVSDILAK